MSRTKRTPEIPPSIPKLEAELIRDAYETTRADSRGTGTKQDTESDDGAVVSETESRDFHHRILDIGLSEETLSELGIDPKKTEKEVTRLDL
ncbi:hypothetical protein [Haladaptatus sp. NG-SE-30]